ncbi:MAG: HD domain-containing phosphohydrolase [Acidaminococcaceae bacterium]
MDNRDGDLQTASNLQELPLELLEGYFPTHFSEGETTNIIKFNINTQRLLLKIFYNFTKITDDKIDSLINITLKGICEIYDADRCNIFRISEDRTKMCRTYTWQQEGLAPDCFNLEYAEKEILPWGTKKLLNLDTINIGSLDEMPEEAAKEREILRSCGIKSIVSVPIACNDNLLGCIAFDSLTYERSWSKEIIAVLTILADIFGSAFKRKKQIEELEKLDKYYHTVFENTGLPAFIIGENMEVLQSSMNWEGIFGYSRRELEGKNWMECLPNEEMEKIKNYHYTRREEHNNVPQKYTAHVIDKFGRVRDCLVNVSLIPGTKNSAVTLSDITQYNRIGRAMKVTTAINTAQLHAVDEQTLLEDVCKKIVDIGGYRFAWIGYISDDANQNVIPVTHAGFEDGYLKLLKIQCKKPHNDDDYYVPVLTGVPSVCRNIEKDLNFPLWKEAALARCYKAYVVIPMYLGGEPERAVLVIYSGEEEVFDEEEVALIKETADDLVFGIKYLRNRIAREKTAEKLAHSLQQKDDLLLEIVDALAASVEAKDPYTAGHQKRVGALTKAIAKKMKLLENDINGISIAGSIHDIGKIQIPSEILCKPGTLLKEEFSLIKTHSKAGYDIVKNIDFPYPVADILLQHHERLDGSGYPEGLRDDEILLGAKIVAVADVVEAISAHRPYRPALGIDKALEEIDRLKGIQFDKEVVETCLSLFREDGFKFS